MSDEILARLDKLQAGQESILDEIRQLRSDSEHTMRAVTALGEKFQDSQRETRDGFDRVGRMLEKLALRRAS